ncbi:hypothetical protein FACS1894132_08140 [Clostridia bacterium]|nr:hypothetical protein FACS1894132_08140 [Clostridia bacterium]
MGFFDKFKRDNTVVETSEIVEKTEIVEVIEPQPMKADKKAYKKEVAVSYVKAIILGMGLTAEMFVEDDDKGIIITISDEGVIGKNGDVIDAIQYLTSTIVNRRESSFFRISINSNGYREKREEVLGSLAKKICSNVVKTGVAATMLPMNAYERRIVHSQISEIQGVYSKSVGEEPNRKIVVYPVNKKAPRVIHVPQRNNSNQKRDFQKHEPREYVPKPVKPLDIGTSFEKDFLKNR